MQSPRRSLVDDLKLSALSVGTTSSRSIGGRLGNSLVISDNTATALHRSIVLNEKEDLEAYEKTSLLSSGFISESPPLAVWIGPALICASAYAFYNIFIKKGSASIYPILGGVILQFVSAIFGLILMGVIVFYNRSNENAEHLQYDKNGLLWSTCAGVAVGLAEMLSFCVNGMGVEAVHSIPIIIGGSVMFGSLLGLILLGEELTWHGWLGIALLVTGIGYVSTDGGDKAVEAMPGDVAIVEPPLYIWIGPALACALAYAFYNIFIKKGSASINPILGGVVLQLVAAVFGSTLLGCLILFGGEGASETMLHYDSKGLLWSFCAGIAVGTAEMLSFTVSGMGVDAMQSIPVIIGGSVMFGAVLGLIMLGETMLLHGWFGVALLVTGIGFVATDPGEKVAGH